jgi:anaerobic selenocysteine-containing dehydrogenase
MHDFAAEVVEDIRWIPRAQVEEAVRLIWHSRPVSNYAWSGQEQHTNVSQTAGAMSLLYALTGSFDAKGDREQTATLSARLYLPNARSASPPSPP